MSNLDAGNYNITAKAVTADGSEASPYTRKQHTITVTTDATDQPPPPDNTSCPQEYSRGFCRRKCPNTECSV